MSMDEKCRWDGAFPDIRGGVDLNCGSMIGLIFGVDNPEGDHEHRQDTVRTVDGFPALDDVLAHRRTLWRRSRCSGVQVHRTVSSHGFRPAHLARELARYRSLPLGSVFESVSHGLSIGRQALDAGRCQRDTRLAHLGRVRPAPDRSGARALQVREPRDRTDRNRLRSRRHDHRPLPVVVSVGAIPLHQGGDQVAHAAGPARRNPQFHPYFRRKTA